MNVIRASGALRKSIDARARGASREVLTQLSADAMMEQKNGRPVAKPTTPRRSNVVDLDRARLEREWQGVAE